MEASLFHWNLHDLSTSELTDQDNERVLGIWEKIFSMTQGKLPDFASLNELTV